MLLLRPLSSVGVSNASYVFGSSLMAHRRLPRLVMTGVELLEKLAPLIPPTYLEKAPCSSLSAHRRREDRDELAADVDVVGVDGEGPAAPATDAFIRSDP